MPIGLIIAGWVIAWGIAAIGRNSASIEIIAGVIGGLSMG